MDFLKKKKESAFGKAVSKEHVIIDNEVQTRQILGIMNAMKVKRVTDEKKGGYRCTIVTSGDTGRTIARFLLEANTPERKASRINNAKPMTIKAATIVDVAVKYATEIESVLSSVDTKQFYNSRNTVGIRKILENENCDLSFLTIVHNDDFEKLTHYVNSLKIKFELPKYFSVNTLLSFTVELKLPEIINEINKW